jgi:C1A family cysteine protease
MQFEHLETTVFPLVVDLRPVMPPVYDQGELGSCTANAIAGAFEYERKRQKLQNIVTPSRLFIYYNERLIEGTVNEDAGAEIRDGIKSVVSQGVCPETEWPYDITKFTVKPSPQCYTDALKETVTSYARVSQYLSQMKLALVGGFPIILGIQVYASFESDQVAQTGVVPLPTTGEQCLGGHAVLVVGYEETKDVFIMRNSWGTDWGQKGYFTIPYAYLLNSNLSSDFWIIKSVKS